MTHQPSTRPLQPRIFDIDPTNTQPGLLAHVNQHERKILIDLYHVAAKKPMKLSISLTLEEAYALRRYLEYAELQMNSVDDAAEINHPGE